MSVSTHMENYRLLQLLPGELKVADCSECGRLLTSCWKAFREHGALGLRVLGRWKGLRNGHRRPICRTCEGPLRMVPGPGEHRPIGQGERIWRGMQDL